MATRKIKNSWWIDFSFDRERIRKKSPENSKAGAEAYEAVLRQKLARGESITKADKKLGEKDQKFEEFAWKWFNTYVQSNNKHSERRRKMYALRTNLLPFFGNTPIGKISSLQIEEYKAKHIKRGLAPKTINNHLMVLGKCLKVAQEWLELEKIPKITKLKTPPAKFDFLSSRECDLLLSNMQDVWREITLTALKTGLRIGELKGLMWQDINWNNRTINVRHSWCEYKKGLVSPKSNKERQIPLVDEVHDMLIKRDRNTNFVFMGSRNRRFNGDRLNEELLRGCRKAGIRKVTCHVLRHTFASHLAMAGASMKAIQELLGHADLETTMRYAHLSQSSLRQTMELLGSRNTVLKNTGRYMVNSKKHTLENSDANRVSNSEISLY
ncbi:MAG: tyrosine-type recombinase/integrase [Nitrospinales bacterium]